MKSGDSPFLSLEADLKPCNRISEPSGKQSLNYPCIPDTNVRAGNLLRA